MAENLYHAGLRLKKFIDKSGFTITDIVTKTGIARSSLYDMFAKMKERAPHEKLPEVQPIMADFIKPDKNLKFIWIGHSTFIVNLDGKIILFDPVFSDYAFTYDFFIKRFQSPAISLNELPKIDYIVLSHNHYDHLDEKSMRSFKDKNIKRF